MLLCSLYNAGSIFMKNCNVILALLFGYFVAGVSNYNGLPYVDTTKIEEAPVVDFLWTQWFGIGLYGPAVIPVSKAFVSCICSCYQLIFLFE